MKENNWLSWRFNFTRWGRTTTWPGGRRSTREWCSSVFIDQTFYFLHSGKMTLLDHSTGARYSLHPGLCMIIPPGVDFEFIDPNPHVMAAYFHWDFPGNKRKVSGKKLPLPLIMEAPDFTMFDQASRHAVELLNRSSRLDGCHCEEERLAAEYILKSLILEALGAQERQAPKSHYEKTVSKALAVLQEDPKRFRSVEQWARFMGYSTSHFRAICLEVTRERPVDILIKTRIAHAKRLLNHSNLTIKMIAEQLGYEDANYLSRQFYEVTGVTAKEYRRNSAPTARG